MEGKKEKKIQLLEWFSQSLDLKLIENAGEWPQESQWKQTNVSGLQQLYKEEYWKIWSRANGGKFTYSFPQDCKYLMSVFDNDVRNCNSLCEEHIVSIMVS